MAYSAFYGIMATQAVRKHRKHLIERMPLTRDTREVTQTLNRMEKALRHALSRGPVVRQPADQLAGR